MIRDVARLADRAFDVLVIGGGIYGLAIAYDAAQRGLAVALAEGADFGSGASFNHLRTIHGGLRYLQTLDLARSRESVVERRTLAIIAPHAVKPLPVVLPLSPSPTRGVTAMRAGFLLDRFVAFDRNRGVPATHRLPPGRVETGARARDLAPFAPARTTGAAVWHDYVTTEADRLTFSFALAAWRHGAVLANYATATALLADGRRVIGARVRDALDGRDVDVRARITVNATGGAIDGLLGPLGAALGLPMLKAMNLVTRREGGETAVGGRSPSGRYLFMVPWRGRALFGTWESRLPCPPDHLAVADADVVSFIGDINQAFPGLALAPADVAMIHRGIVPATGAGERFVLRGHEEVRDHATDASPLDGLVSVVGAKYTTARAVAERVTDRVCRKLDRPAVPCRTAAVALVPGDGSPNPSAVRGTERIAAPTPDVRDHLAAAYGPAAADVLALCADQPELAERVSDASPVVGAELVWAARHEMAVTLADAVVRRTPLGVLGYPGDRVAGRAADLVGGELGWTIERRRTEMAALRDFYAGVFGLQHDAPRG